MLRQLFFIVLSGVTVSLIHSAEGVESEFDSRQAAEFFVAEIFGNESSEHRRFMEEAVVRPDQFFPAMGHTETVADGEVGVKVSVTRRKVYGFDFPKRLSHRECTAQDLEEFRPAPEEFTDIAKKYLGFMTWDVDLGSLETPPHYSLGIGGTCHSMVSWSQKMDENNVSKEAVQVQLTFDVSTREIHGFSVVMSRYLGATPIKWPDAVEIVRSELGEEGGFEITRGILLNLFDCEGGEHPVWAVMYRVDAPTFLWSEKMQTVRSERFVDVKTGELFERPEDVVGDCL